MIQKCEKRKSECTNKIRKKQQFINDYENIIKMMKDDMKKLDLLQEVIDEKKRIIKDNEEKIEEIEKEIKKIENSSECKDYKKPCQ